MAARNNNGKIVHRTMKGLVIDVEKIRMANGDKKALGNANLNARGDKLDSSGRIVKRREDIVNEYNQKRDEGIRYVGLSSIDQNIVPDNIEFRTIDEIKKDMSPDKPDNIKRRKRLIDEDEE